MHNNQIIRNNCQEAFLGILADALEREIKIKKIIFKHNSKKYLYNFEKTVEKKWAKLISTKLK